MKRLTTEEFVRRARLVHGDKFNYDKVVYIDIVTPIVITCPIHGDFEQTPNGHLSGRGCKDCKNDLLSKTKAGKPHQTERTMSWGGAIFDYPKPYNETEETRKAYITWRSMLVRCYSDEYHIKKPTYKDCSVCAEWLCFSNFFAWYKENYVEHYVLDKDILVKRNKVYSPETCCFVPNEINTLFVKKNANRGVLPIGVYKKDGRFAAKVSCSKNGIKHSKYFGTYNTVADAFAVYKKEKELYIQEVATEYYNKGKITERVYNALMKYEVDIND